ncbi:uncharacterized protein LOC119684983 [Teleopsis dalmanni]|uniref:uncharacterized protein LOC119684983 n=1 Tax=Teleopsis dalmanni TaxID=139649 RepID=UPI0018CFC3D2|nr:uncharacterized protein LOC119684983 [Teleopsis dalmanni]
MTNVYNSNVLIGNWRETQCAEEEERNRIESMKKNKVSLTDRLNRFNAVLNKEITPDKTQNYITFGSVIQLLPYYMLYNEAFGTKKSGALSIAVSADALTSGDVINELCEMRIMFCQKPTIRNSFRVISVDDENHDGEPLFYEQHFRLEVLHPTERMFLYSAPKRIDLQILSNTPYLSYKRGEASLPLGVRFAKVNNYIEK